MPDNLSQYPEATLQAAQRPNAVRPSGLPIFSTEPLTTVEKALLELTARAHRRIADALDAAVQQNRVTAALAVINEAASLAQTDARTALLLGSNR